MSYASMTPSDWLEQLVARYASLHECACDVSAAYDALAATFENGGKLLICGNGGSASDADHISGELLKGFARKRRASSSHCSLIEKLQLGLPAIPLANLTGLMTAFSNDCDPQLAFAQLVMSLGKSGDAILCISTSGNSKNVVNAAEVAKAIGLKVVSLTGKTGGALSLQSDVCVKVPETETFKVQELHLPVYHCLCLMLESRFFKE